VVSQLPEEFKALVPVLVFIAISGFVIFMMIRSLKKLGQKLEPIAQALGGEVVSNFLAGSYVRLRNYDAEVRVALTPGSKNSPPLLALRQLSALGFVMGISRRNAASNILNRVLFQSTIQTGDPIFDQKYSVSSRSPEQAAGFLYSAVRRQAVDYFFENGFNGLGTDGKSVFAQKPNYQDADLEVARIQADLEQLRKFVAG